VTGVTIGDWTFDSVEYDAENDVLYLSIGEPREGVGEETPEGHIARFDDDGTFVGVTIFDVQASINEGSGGIKITLPQHTLPRTECLGAHDVRRLVA
jgi:uncharacterized protein YuzE